MTKKSSNSAKDFLFEASNERSLSELEDSCGKLGVSVSVFSVFLMFLTALSFAIVGPI